MGNDKVEKWLDDLEIYESSIEYYIAEYCERYKVESINELSGNRWNSILLYVYDYVFKPARIGRKYHSNIDYNNPELILAIYNKYERLCLLYDKGPCITGFSYMTGINSETIINWGNNNIREYYYTDSNNVYISNINEYVLLHNTTINTELEKGNIYRLVNKAHCEVYKKLTAGYQSFLENCVQSGKGSTVGQLATLNYRYGWNQTTQTVETGGLLTSSQDITSRHTLAGPAPSRPVLELSDNETGKK